MGVTRKLLNLYRVDQQIHGLQASLRSAEAYLKQQDSLLSKIDEQLNSIKSELRQLEASIHNVENEVKQLDERIATLRDRMNNARTSKEHSALLTEINTLKADKALFEESMLEKMTKADELRTQTEELESQRGERDKVRGVAVGDRDKRAEEIKDRLEELKKEREKVAAEVPAPAMSAYEDRLVFGIDEVMAPVNEQSRRNMEYTCGNCYTMLPIEQVNVLLKRADLAQCPSCQTLLYMEEELHDSMNQAAEKKRKKKTVPDD